MDDEPMIKLKPVHYFMLAAFGPLIGHLIWLAGTLSVTGFWVGATWVVIFLIIGGFKASEDN